jgi:hypothetical protein
MNNDFKAFAVIFLITVFVIILGAVFAMDVRLIPVVILPIFIFGLYFLLRA